MANEHKEQTLEKMRHSTAHLLAAALLELYPGTKFGIGPAIEFGFYYDIEASRALGVDDFEVIENKMNEIKARNDTFRRKEMTLIEARALFTELGQCYKLDILDRIGNEEESDETTLSKKQGEYTVSVYYTGSFVDLCRGPHVAFAKDIGVFKLKSISGAYWRGDETQPMLQRIYGVAFATKEELDHYFDMIVEAEKRDHRKLGKELELFTLIDDVGAGLPLFYPKGALLRRCVEDYITNEQEQRGYVPIWIPHITKESLYRTSGHLDKYDAMYPSIHLDDDRYYLKPMNCPHFMMLYNSQPHSYRQLPLRYTCTTTCYRHEKSGELSGLTRVRALTQDDCHVFCTHDQVEEEISVMLDMIKEVYRVFDFNDYTVSISIRDRRNTDKYIGSAQMWDAAENALRDVVEQVGMKSIIIEGEAAFYGPKLDFTFKDALGRSWQLSTIQLDYNLPERFCCEYTAADGTKKRPVVIHRAILGSTERFLGIMIEHFAGKFPLWLSPVQLSIIPVGLAHHEACRVLADYFKSHRLRVSIDDANESVSYKIRNSEKQKIPYMIVIGDKEIAQEDQLTVRIRGLNEPKTYSRDAFIAMLWESIVSKSLDLPHELK